MPVMKFSLLDSNVWVALTIDRHEHHRDALAWFDEVPDDRSACFCRMTQNSFLRLVTSKSIFQEDTMTNEQAIRAYRQFRLDPRVGWMDEPVGLEDQWFAAASVRSPATKRWMDAYLYACARSSDARLVTFDSGFRQYESEGLSLALLANARK
jgi:toxin-antitoxin system PIN domain toxin